MTRFVTALLALLLFAAPLWAGEVTIVGREEIRCVRAIRAGDALPEGIHFGRLPRQLLVQRCDDLWLMLRRPGGGVRISGVLSSMIPKFRAKRRPFAIPDARVTVGRRDIRSAWLIRPTRRYAHGVLGDDVEAGGLAIYNTAGRRVTFELPEREVFEDRMARLVDLDGNDQTDEIVVVRTHVRKGASLAVFAHRGEGEGERLEMLAGTPFIGRANRWLNPAAAGDFDGDGRREIAWVETPHINGVLKVGRLERAGGGWRMKVLAALPGFSNHRAGSRELQGAVAVDWNGDGRPEIVLPSADYRRMMVVTFADGRLRVLDEIPFDGEMMFPVLAGDLDGDGRGEVYIVTKDGRLLAFTP